MEKKITIAIDGWSSCGKSTLAKALAKTLNYVHVDSGAMYRGVALFALRKELVSTTSIEEDKVVDSLTAMDISFVQHPQSGKAELHLNGENVEEEIRTISVSNVVSAVAKIKEVRTFLVEQQRKMGAAGEVVMDGRDIGSVVFPSAELKLFVTADPKIRAQRRFDELKVKGQQVTFEEVEENLKLRDKMDANREESPLIQTEDAIVLDNTSLTPDEQLQLAKEYVEKAQSM
jgi:cytidylate kinase